VRGHPHYIKDKELLERVQHRFTRMIKEVRGKDYLDRLKELNLWTLEERRNRTDLVELFKMYKRFTAIHFESLFTLDCNNKGTRGHLIGQDVRRMSGNTSFHIG